MTYAQLKAYFETAELPTMLHGAHKVYENVPYTVSIYIDCIEMQIVKCKINDLDVRNSNIAKTYKTNLQELYNDLQDRSKWDLGLEKLESKQRI